MTPLVAGLNLVPVEEDLKFAPSELPMTVLQFTNKSAQPIRLVVLPAIADEDVVSHENHTNAKCRA